MIHCRPQGTVQVKTGVIVAYCVLSKGILRQCYLPGCGAFDGIALRKLHCNSEAGLGTSSMYNCKGFIVLCLSIEKYTADAI